VAVKDKIRVDEKDLSTSEADFWSENVPSKVTRYIVAFLVSGDGTNDARVTISRKKGATTTKKYVVSVSATGTEPVPRCWSRETPIMVLFGGENLSVVASAGTPSLSVVYYDDEL